GPGRRPGGALDPGAGRVLGRPGAHVRHGGPGGRLGSAAGRGRAQRARIAPGWERGRAGARRARGGVRRAPARGGGGVSTLLLRLAGPMQSWGTQSRFSVRDAGTEPSKSGVIGLLCAALGRPRAADLSDLVALRMGVRVERPGSVRREYQTAGGGRGYGVARADGSPGETVLSNRYYLADADFLVGLEGDA